MLERTTAQTLWWVLGHPATVAVFTAMLAVAVLVASAVAAGSVRGVDDSSTPGRTSETTADTGPTDATLSLFCPTAAQLAVTASGTGSLNLRIEGPATAQGRGTGTVAAAVTGPAGSYTARVTATGTIDRMSWHSTAGACTG